MDPLQLLLVVLQLQLLLLVVLVLCLLLLLLSLLQRARHGGEVLLLLRQRQRPAGRPHRLQSGGRTLLLLLLPACTAVPPGQGGRERPVRWLLQLVAVRRTVAAAIPVRTLRVRHSDGERGDPSAPWQHVRRTPASAVLHCSTTSRAACRMLLL